MTRDLQHLHLPPDCGDPHGHELVVAGLTVRYGDTLALEDIGLRTRCGRCVALVGPNGAGKSTLMKCLAGLIRPGSGEIAWRGRPLARATSEIAYLAQRSEVDWQFPLSVRGLVEMGRYPHLGWWRPFRRIDRERADEALETMRLTDLAGRQIGALSGGQQQRAFVARALAQEAHILLLDEPFAGLDRPSRDLLAELLGHLAAGGRLVVAAHHDLDSVPEIFDEALLLNRRVVAFGPVDEVFHEQNLAACFGRTLRIVSPESPENRPDAAPAPRNRGRSVPA